MYFKPSNIKLGFLINSYMEENWISVNSLAQQWYRLFLMSIAMKLGHENFTSDKTCSLMNGRGYADFYVLLNSS